MWLDRRNIWTAIRALLFLGVTTFASERAHSQSVNFTFGPDVPIDDQQTIRDAITLGHQLFQTYFDTTVQSTTRVFVYAESERLIDVYLAVRNLTLESSPWVLEQWKDCGGAEAGFDWIFIPRRPVIVIKPLVERMQPLLHPQLPLTNDRRLIPLPLEHLRDSEFLTRGIRP